MISAIFQALGRAFANRSNRVAIAPAAMALFALVVGAACGRASAQAFTHADSGWVNIFNGKDWTGIYGRQWGTNSQGADVPITQTPGAPWEILYAGTDTAVMRVNGTSPGGNVGTDDTTYSHYRVRVEQKFDQLAGGNNGGITFHTDESVIRMDNNWPRSIEFQMQQEDAGGAYSIQQVAFTTTVNGNRYAPGGTTVQACEHGCNARNYSATPLISNDDGTGHPRWLRFELVTRGSDSATYIINDTVVFKLWNIRIFNDAENHTPDGPDDHGGFGLQSEGAAMDYRHWEVMEFPPATPMTANYLHRLFLDNPDSGVSVAAQSVYAIKWRTIGAADVKNVHLEYDIGTGWQTIIDSTNNTGSYNWTVPNQATNTLRIRVSGPAWTWADSSRGFNSITASSGIALPSSNPVSFSITGKGEVFANVGSFTHLDIMDVFGRLVRDFSIENRDIVWNLDNKQGNRVRPGFYFIQLSGRSFTQAKRILIF